jgi:hypothetical protein
VFVLIIRIFFTPSPYYDPIPNLPKFGTGIPLQGKLEGACGNWYLFDIDNM